MGANERWKTTHNTLPTHVMVITVNIHFRTMFFPSSCFPCILFADLILFCTTFAPLINHKIKKIK